jgi:hypothetical protein
MPSVKEEVAGWELVESDPGSYAYEKRFGNHIYKAGMSEWEGRWALYVGGGYPEMEQYGGVHTEHVLSFKHAKNLLHCFMKRCEGGGYNGVIDTADSCGWPD